MGLEFWVLGEMVGVALLDTGRWGGKNFMERRDVGPWEIPFYISHRWLTDGLANGVKRSVSLGPICFPPRNSL